ncbi:MAG: DUF1565 domain-containing protein [Planctomycetes bacterium]|nr:DUF1565 domain-containing protein [Planctomycetota bacterium]
MKEPVTLRVGVNGGDIVGNTNKALQAAVDYVGNLGGGVVEIGPGQYLMGDSLHLRSQVTLRGAGADTVLKKAPGVQTDLVLDGDYGEEQITVKDPTGFHVGVGVAVRDDSSGGFHTTVATIIGKLDNNTFRINKPLNADCMVKRNAIAKTVFPVISGYHLENVRVENLVIDGNRENNPPLNGCRGAGIFFYRVHSSTISNCTVRDYNGDGISFQQSSDVTVEKCLCENNAALGLHPGSGSQRPVVRGNQSLRNGNIGLFLCWRVRHGVFEDNECRDNGGAGISIGHKDSDNVFRRNVIVGNRKCGVHFRKESEPMGGHRNRFENNTIEDNTDCGIRIDGETNDTIIVSNTIRDTGKGVQKIGVFIGKDAKGTTVKDNILSGHTEGDVKNEE